MKTAHIRGLCRRIPQAAPQRCYSAVPTQTPSKIGVYAFGRYAYYDAVVAIADLNIVRTDAYYIARQRARLEQREDVHMRPEDTVAGASDTKSHVFDPRAGTKAPSFEQVFGGSSKTATQSSRRDLSYRNKHKLIAGVKVPARPIEPDNCCMSGCVNCVWELFNEDLEEWRHKRLQAARRLMAQNDQGGLGAKGKMEVWPRDWELPPRILDAKFVSSDLRAHIEKNKGKMDDPDEVKGMPVGLQVFAMFEKKKKEQRKNKWEKSMDKASHATSVEQPLKPSDHSSATV